MGRIGLGETSSNLLMNALVKRFNKSLGLVRGIEECTLMAIGLIGARSYVTLFTILLSLFFGYFINYVYRLVKYDSVNTKHLFIIGGK